MLEPTPDLLLAEGYGEEIALDEFALGGAELAELFLCLDAFGDGPQVEVVGELDDGVNQSGGFVAFGDWVDERAVDLDLVDGELAQVAE